MRLIPETLYQKILLVLIRQVGDHRYCPHCNKSFIPNDTTTGEALDLVKEIKETRPCY